jgi:hypothetical protein
MQQNMDKGQKTFDLKAFVGKGSIKAEESSVMDTLRIGMAIDNLVPC